MVFIQYEFGDSGPRSKTTINKPAVHCLKSFFEFHPKRQNFDLTVKLNYQNIYFRNNKPSHLLTNDENTNKNSLFVLFGILQRHRPVHDSTFISGYNVTNSKHIYICLSIREYQIKKAVHSMQPVQNHMF